MFTNDKGQCRTHTYYPGGLLKSVTLPDGETETYEYNKNGSVTKVTDNLGNTTTIKYDLLDRPTQITSAPSIIGQTASIRQYEYDPVGNIVKISDNDGNILDLKYSPTGRLVEFVDGDGTILYSDANQKDSSDTSQTAPDIRPEGPFDFIAKIRKWRTDTIEALKATQQKPTYGNSMEVFGMAGATMFWLSNRDDSGGVEQGARGEPASMLQQPTPQWPQAPQAPLTPPNQPPTIHTRNPNAMDTPSTTNDVIDGIGSRAGGVTGTSVMAPWTPPLTVPLDNIPRMGSAQQAVPSEHTSGRGGQYTHPVDESTWVVELIMQGQGGGTFGGSIGIASGGYPRSWAVTETTSTGATLGGGASLSVAITQFPDMTDLNSLGGRGTEIGANILIPKTPFFIGAEHRISHTGQGQPDFRGSTVLFGAGIGAAMPGHVQNTNTTVHHGIDGVLVLLSAFVPAFSKIRESTSLARQLEDYDN